MVLSAKDQIMLRFIFGATGAVFLPVVLLILLGVIGAFAIIFPLTWFIGGMMTWGYDKMVDKVK